MAVTRFRRAIGYVSLLAVALTISTAAAPIARAQDYAAILAASDRTAADRENDKRREAPKLLAFIGPKSETTRPGRTPRRSIPHAARVESSSSSA